MRVRVCGAGSTSSRDAALHPYPGRSVSVLAWEDVSAVTSKTRRNRTRRRSGRDRKAARRLAVILHAIGIKPNSIGHSWTEVLIGLRAQYASMTDQQRGEAHVAGTLLIQEKRLDTISATIIAGPSQPMRKNSPSEAHKGPGIMPQRCDQCWSWGPKSIWNSRERAEEYCAAQKDPELNAYPCPHGIGWHVGHLRGRNKSSA
jgi:hypothetical protein